MIITEPTLLAGLEVAPDGLNGILIQVSGEPGMMEGAILHNTFPPLAGVFCAYLLLGIATRGLGCDHCRAVMKGHT